MKYLLPVLLLLIAASIHASAISEANLAVDRGDYERAFEILVPLAEDGDVDALGNLGNMYGFGQGVEQDIDKAHSYWSQAAEMHLGTAMFNIAVVYENGLGNFDANESIALIWFNRAAEHRHFQSMLHLSTLYALGKKVDRDRVRAVAWANLAASNAPSQNDGRVATGQVRELLKGMSDKEIREAQEISNELAAIIDANIREYKTQ